MKLLLLLFTAHLIAAAEDAGFVVWKSSELKKYEQTLRSKPGANPYVRLKDISGHPAVVVHREMTGPAEYHERYGHLIYVISGEASVVVGGELSGNRRSVPDPLPGQVTINADSLTGGESKQIREGDIVQIPTKAPHWFKVDSGKQITYLMVILESK
jgi:mannose-6-phosphate isomerase-like protein (cupin superfamily)